MKPTVKALCLFLVAVLLLSGCGAPDGGTIEVSFYLNNDTEDMFTSIKGEPGSSVFSPGGTPEREGYLFTGWYLDKEGTEAYIGTADENLSVYAGWAEPVEVVFAGEGITLIEPLELAKGDPAQPPAEPFREGFTFTGWYADELLTVPWDFAAPVERPMTLYAGWSGAERVITLHLGEGMTEPLLVSGLLMQTPEAPSRTGFSFGGWFEDEALTIPFDLMSDTGAGYMDLYAMWIELEPGETPAPTPEPTRRPSSSTSKPTSKPTATPSPSAKGFTVTFDAGGGTAVSSYTGVPANSAIQQPNNPTRPGYTFGGWYKEPTLASAWNFSSDRVTANITLYARWNTGFTVTFNSNGGSSVGSITGVQYGARITAPTNPTKLGFRFVRWYKESTLTNAWDFSSDVVVSNVTLYAMWSEAGEVTVKCDPNYGSFEPWSRTVKAGETVTLPTPSTREGYTFLGWFTPGGSHAGGGGASYTVTETITLTAEWRGPASPTSSS